MTDANEYWLISVMNDKDSHPGDAAASSQVINKLKKEVGSLATVSHFEVPALRVGTLDKLMIAGDLLNKVDANVEQVVRKIERQFADISKSSNEGSNLSVDNKPPGKYIENFQWNDARYPIQRSVDDLIKSIVTTTTKSEVTLKENVAFYQEKRQRKQLLERQKDGNLMVANLADKILPKISDSDILDSDYLKTVVIVVSKNNKKDFDANYESIGNEIVNFTWEEDETKSKGSPVIPGSKTEVCTDDDGYTCYLVTILKKFLEEFKVAVQTARHLVRDIDLRESFDEYKLSRDSGEDEDPLAIALQDEQSAMNNVRDWCKSSFGDVFSAWIHVKAIRVFVESVLRYGLPVNFTAAAIRPVKRSSDKKVREKLSAKWITDMDKTGMMSMHADDANAAGVEEVFPYVSFTIVPEQSDHHR